MHIIWRSKSAFLWVKREQIDSDTCMILHDSLKGLVHPKLKILSLITPPHVIPNL